jgi:hypothetical protein
MVSLMKGLDSKDISDGTDGGRGTLALPGDSGGIVTDSVHYVLVNISMLGQDIKLG